MSHPDPLFDPDNAYDDDEMFNEPNESDIPFVEYLYDYYNDFNDSMDGDHDSSMTSAGFGTNEDYGDYGNDNDDYYGEDF